MDRRPLSLQLGSPALSEALEVIQARINGIPNLLRQWQDLQVGDGDRDAVRAIPEYIAEYLPLAAARGDVRRTLATKSVDDFGRLRKTVDVG